ncbi:calcium-binding protein [Bradyrhizobium nitroreducens]|uniref:calcium-binding protein n=1 Tax=Bradyrhizobium nitroreducens TaxID=709803 RepID=UPI001374B417|nr:calcium-binding protein [Bradyrhizobium nitroreducens]
MVTSMFGASIDVDAIKVTDQSFMPLQNTPMVPTGETLYWPHGMAFRPYSEDFSTAPLVLQAEFMHEMTHVWQNQHGERTNSLFFDQLFQGQKLYDLSAVSSDTPWSNLNLEQQGEVVKNLYLLQKGGSVSGTLSLQDYDNVFGSSAWHGDEPTHPILTPGPVQQCFVKGTPILLADGNYKPIERIEVGDVVQAFDGLGGLQPRRVLRLFRNVTTELLELTPTLGCWDDADAAGFSALTVTPGHAFLTANGEFTEIGETIRRAREEGASARIVLSTGQLATVEAKRIAWGETGHLYERSELIRYESSGTAALAPSVELGWKTYNFEVEDLNTYVAAGVRVHNQSAPTIAISQEEFEHEFGHEFSGSEADQELLVNAIVDGAPFIKTEYVEIDGTSEYTAPYLTSNGDKIVITADANNWFASMVRNGEIDQIIQNSADGSSHVTIFDPSEGHAYTTVGISKDANGNITNVAATLDPNVLAAGGSIGQIFGSAIGRSIAGSNAFAQLAAGTVGGYIGQRLGTALAASLQGDLSGFNFAQAFDHFGVGISGAAAGSVASFLTAELGTALGLDGFGAQLFNTVVGGYAGSVLNQVIQTSFTAGTSAINWASAFSNATSAVSGSIGSLLATQIVHAENLGGAIGGQIGGAVGGIIGATTIGLSAVLGVIVPGIGAFFGTFLGTLVGNVIGAGDKYPQSYHSVVQGEHFYLTNLNHVQDGGDVSVSDAMANAAIGMANAYLSAVDGVAIGPGIASSLIGYVVVSNGTSVQYQTSYDGGQNYDRFRTADEAVQSFAPHLLQGTEAIGGNLLMKRAHHNGNAADMLTLAGDLQVAQDYERYLDNREVINALIAANPNTAFTEGWAATFARVQDLGLSHYGAVDFLGGMVTGYLDSVRKAGLSFSLADVSVKHGGDGSITIAIHVPGNVDIPGALSVFASRTDVVDDATGKTVQLVFSDALAAAGYHGPASSTISNGVQMVTAAGGSNFWFGRDDMPNNFNGAAAGQVVLVGGALNDVMSGSGSADFMDGGAGDDNLYGGYGNDVMRGGKGADSLNGARGNDTYVFGRGDGIDTIFDHTVETGTNGGHLDGGVDALAFASGIVLSDVVFQLSGNDMIVGIKDPANPGLALAQMSDRITLQNWLDPLDRIEKFVFADGTALDFSSRAGLTAGFATIDTAGSTSLMQIGTNYYFYANGIEPMLKYGGSPFTSTMLEGRTLLGVEQTSFGYELAIRLPGTDQYTVWNTDSSGNVVGNGTGGVVSGASYELESLEPSFHQDINGDGMIGVWTPIEQIGATSLTLSGGAYYFVNVSSVTGLFLKYQGSPVVAADWGTWSIIGVEQVAGGGYDVVWKNSANLHYSVWSTDSNGNFLTTLGAAPEVLGNDASLRALEPTLHQDLNGDGTIGVPVTIEALGSTSPILSAGNYYLIGISTGTGPVLKSQGTPVVAANYGAYSVIAAEQVAGGGYDVAWKNASTGKFSIWSTDSNGNFLTTLGAAPELGATEMSLKALETAFHQDLNGDGAVGMPSIELNGSTSTVLYSGYYYLLSTSTGTGQVLKYQGSPVIAANYGAYSVIAAEQVSGGGYDVAWKNSSTGKFSIWSTDSNGNFVTTLAAAPEVTGTDPSLKALEATFHQDLNGDGVITGSPVVLDLDGNGVGLVSLSNSTASFDMDGQGVREHTAWVSSGDALLAIDLGANGSAGPDGVIDQTKEIVFTAWAPGATSDMAALAQVFDTNRNGQLDAADSRWSDFRIWQDANGDGISQAGEVKSLDAIGIVAIGLDPKGPSQTFADGSAISGLANFVWKDGTTGTAADVSFAYRPGASGTAANEPSTHLAEVVAEGWHEIDGGHGVAQALDQLLASAASHHWHIA